MWCLSTHSLQIGTSAMDCKADDTDDIGIAAQLAANMDTSTQAGQSSPQTSVDRLAWDLIQDSPQPVISESGTEKRDFDSSFPLSPGRDAKRLCSRSPVHLVPSNDNGGAVDNSNIKSEDAIEALQTGSASSLNPLQAGLVVETDAPTIIVTSSSEKIKRLDHSCDEICRHLNLIKQLTPSGQIDRVAAMILVNELASLMATESSIPPEEIDQMKCNIAKIYPIATSPNKVEIGGANSQAAPSAISSISELTPVPSDIFTLPPSRGASEAVTSSPKFENRSTQTEEAAIDTEKDALALPDARYNGLSDIDLWERELESIRRLQPLVDGSYKTVNVPLRVPTSQPASASQRTPVSTQQGLKYKLSFVPKVKPIPGYALRFNAVAGGIWGNKDHDVISVHDTSDDEVEEIRARASHVGGGDRDTSQIQYSISDEDEETSLHNPRFRHELQLDGNSYSMNDYEDHDIDEDIQGEVVMYRNRPTPAPARHDYDDLEYGSLFYDEESDSSSFIGNELGESSGSGIWDPPNTNVHGSTMVMNEGNAIRRDRSRSPVYQLARVVDKRPYREERHYKRHQPPAQTLREKHPGRVYVQGTSAFARNMNQYGQVKHRYIRDEPESSQFYGYDIAPKEADSTLRYQDRFNNIGEIPGPKTSLRLDLDRYVKDTGINDDVMGMERDIESVYEETFYAGETLDEEQALRSSWANKPTTLYKGFPLVENIGFVAIENQARPAGDCYWRALAYILYGQTTRWDLIKADHQAYLRHVLGDKTHPRHELHAKLNTQFFESNGPAIGKFKANLWQLLHMPHSWTPGAMQQVTADLYNIHLVTFEYDKDKNLCSNVSVRGAYNSRHVFMLFDGSHFQPLAVNEYLG
ncbi:hypothetical protein F4679DRAFT_557206 [Xylaria curta]|nr:hypothetical protein F4679DRAFT_557206 [Xylaria curta]